MPKVLTAVFFLLASATSFAMLEELNPIPVKDRVKLQLWEQGVPEFKKPIAVKGRPLPEEITRVLSKHNL